MGARTISSEVVQATLDGLHSVVDNLGRDSKHSLSWQSQAMEDCQRLLDTGETEAEADLWDRTLVRASLAVNRDVAQPSGFLSEYLSLSLDRRKEMVCMPKTSLAYQSSARVGFMHLALQAHIDSGLLNSSLQVFQTLQAITDSSRVKVIGNFVLKSPDELMDRQNSSLPEFQEVKDFPHTALTQISDRTLGSFLELLSALRLYDVAHWLLASQDIDGPMIAEEKYSSSVLQPALLQFAAATSNVDLLSKVAANLTTPLSEENIIALLYCQISLRQWDRVNDILANLKANGCTIPLASIAHVAQTIVIDEHAVLDFEQDLINQAEDTLIALIRGEHDQHRNSTSSLRFLRRREVNQLSRILSALPGRLATSILPLVKQSGQDHATTLLDSKVFDLIVDGIVQALGPLAGRELWQRWCISPGTQRAVPFTRDGQEKVINPTIRTLNFILASQAPGGDKITNENGLFNDPTLAMTGQKVIMTTGADGSRHVGQNHETLATRSSNNHSVLSWAESVLREFGQPESVIVTELGPYMHQ